MTTPVEDGASFSVSFATGERFDLDMIRLRAAAQLTGIHAWVIAAVYAVEDPEQPGDSLDLGPHNFVTVEPIHCLHCSTRYKPNRRFNECPGLPVDRGQADTSGDENVSMLRRASEARQAKRERRRS